MRKVAILLILAGIATAGFVVYKRSGSQQAAAAAAEGATAPGGGRQGGGGRGGRGQFARQDMPVELSPAKRGEVAEYVTVVGNLIGAATVEVVPKTNGRLESVSVRLGDPVRQGQVIAQLEDREIAEQVKQAEAAYEVSNATIRQREADLKFNQANLERSRNLFERQLIPKQTLDDADLKYQAAVAQLDLARAQFQQSKARLDELKLNLANTIVRSPVDGFIGKRYLDPGASVGPNAPVASVVDIRFVRLVVNLVEKDLRKVTAGKPAAVEVDAYPGETFEGKVARVAPVLDPATRTAQMEVEIQNPSRRLKPGMYARVRLTVAAKPDAVVVPRTAVITVEGKTGVFVANNNTAKFMPVETGIEQEEVVEVVKGIDEGTRVITTGAQALKDGDRIILPNQGRRGGPGGQGGQGRGGNGGARQRGNQ
jgi:membrane fusion protein, multidrug efflux system